MRRVLLCLMVCHSLSAEFADVNRDGLPDIVIGHHFKTPWITPIPIRLYPHRDVKNGEPSFEDITAAAGLEPLLMKAPHVKRQDFDHDGRLDMFLPNWWIESRSLLLRNETHGGWHKKKQQAHPVCRLVRRRTECACYDFEATATN